MESRVSAEPLVLESLQRRALSLALMSYGYIEPYGRRNEGNPFSELMDIRTRPWEDGGLSVLETIMGGVETYADAYRRAYDESKRELLEKNNKSVLRDTVDDDIRDAVDAASENGTAVAVGSYADDDEMDTDEAILGDKPRFRQLINKNSMLLMQDLDEAASILTGIPHYLMKEHEGNGLGGIREREFSASEIDKVARAFAAFSDTLSDIQEIIPEEGASDLYYAIDMLERTAADKTRSNPYMGVRNAVEYLLGNNALRILDGKNVTLSDDRLLLGKKSSIDHIITGEVKEEALQAIANELFRRGTTRTRGRDDDAPDPGNTSRERSSGERCIKALYLLYSATAPARIDTEIPEKLEEISKELKALGYEEGLDGFGPIPEDGRRPSETDLIADNIARQSALPEYLQAKGREDAAYEAMYRSSLAIAFPGQRIAAIASKIRDAAENARSGGKAEKPKLEVSSMDDLRAPGEAGIAFDTEPDPELGNLTRDTVLYEKRSRYLVSLRASKALLERSIPGSYISEEKDTDRAIGKLAEKSAVEIERIAMKPGRMEVYEGFGSLAGLDMKAAVTAFRNAARTAVRRIERIPGADVLKAEMDIRGIQMREALRENDKISDISLEAEVAAAAGSLTRLSLLDSSATAAEAFEKGEESRKAFLDPVLHMKEIERAAAEENRTPEQIRNAFRTPQNAMKVLEYLGKNKGHDGLRAYADLYRNEVQKPYRKALEEASKKAAESVAPIIGVPRNAAYLYIYATAVDHELAGYMRKDDPIRYAITGYISDRDDKGHRARPDYARLSEISSLASDIAESVASLRGLRADDDPSGVKRKEAETGIAVLRSQLEDCIRNEIQNGSVIGKALSQEGKEAFYDVLKAARKSFSESMKPLEEHYASTIRGGISRLMAGTGLDGKDIVDAFRLQDGTLSATLPENIRAVMAIPESRERMQRVRDAVKENARTVKPLTSRDRKYLKELNEAIRNTEEAVKDSRSRIDRAVKIIESRDYTDAVRKVFTKNASQIALAAMDWDEAFGADKDVNLTAERFILHFGNDIRTGIRNRLENAADNAFMKTEINDGNTVYSDAFTAAVKNAEKKEPEAYEAIHRHLDDDGVLKAMHSGKMPNSVFVSATGKGFSEFSVPLMENADEAYRMAAEGVWKDSGYEGTIGSGPVKEALMERDFTKDGILSRIEEKYQLAYKAIEDMKNGVDEARDALVSRLVNDEEKASMKEAVSLGLTLEGWAERSIPSYAAMNLITWDFEDRTKNEAASIIDTAAIKDEEKTAFIEALGKAIVSDSSEPLREAYEDYLRSSFSSLMSVLDAERKVYKERTAEDEIGKRYLEEIDTIRNQFTKYAEKAARIAADGDEKKMSGLRDEYLQNGIPPLMAGDDLSKNTRREFRDYLSAVLAEAVKNGVVPEPFSSYEAEYAKYAEAVSRSEKGLDELLKGSTEYALKYSDIIVKDLSAGIEANENLTPEEKKAGEDFVRYAYSAVSSFMHADTAGAVLRVSEEANSRTGIQLEEDREKAPGKEAKGTVPLAPPSGIRTYLDRVFGKEESGKLRDIALYISSVSSPLFTLPDGHKPDEDERKNLIATAHEAFIDSVSSAAKRLSERVEAAEKEKENRAQYSPTVQYNAAARIWNALMGYYRHVKDGESGHYAEYRSIAEKELDTIIRNNPEELDAADECREKVLSADPENAKAIIRRLAVMGPRIEGIEDGIGGGNIKIAGVKALINRMDKGFPEAQYAIGLSEAYSEEKKLRKTPAIPDKTGMEMDAAGARAFLALIKNPGVMEGVLSVASAGLQPLRTLPEIVKDKEGFGTIQKAIGDASLRYETLLSDARHLEKEAEAEAAIVRTGEAIRKELDSFGNETGRMNYADTVLIGTPKELAAFTRGTRGMDAEESLHRFMESPLSESPVFFELRKLIEKEMRKGGTLEDGIHSVAENLRLRGYDTAAEPVLDKEGNAVLGSDGRPVIRERLSLVPMLMRMAGRSRTPQNIGGGRLLLDNSGESRDRFDTYMPPDPALGEMRISAIMDITPQEIGYGACESAMRSVRSDPILSEAMMPGRGAKDAISSKHDLAVIDLHELPGLTAEKFLDAVHEKLKGRNSAAAAFFSEENRNVVSESAGLAVVSFREVEMKGGKNGTFMDRISPYIPGGGGMRTKRQKSIAEAISSAAINAAAAFGFHKDRDRAIITGYAENGQSVLSAYQKEAHDAEAKEIAEKAYARKEEKKAPERVASRSSRVSEGGIER